MCSHLAEYYWQNRFSVGTAYLWIRRHLKLCMQDYFACFMSFADFSFSKIEFLKYSFRIIISVKLFGSRSGPTLCWAWSGPKLFSIWYRQTALAGKELKYEYHVYNPLSQIMLKHLASCFCIFISILSKRSTVVVFCPGYICISLYINSS